MAQINDSSNPPHFLHTFLNPRSIAFYGASEDLLRNMGTIQLLNLIDNGFPGKIYPIHLHLESIFGLKTYHNIAEIEDPVDLAVIVLNNKIVPQIFRELGQKGVKSIVLVSAGFRELGNQRKRDEIIEIAHELGIRFLGPNCLGFYNGFLTSINPEKPSILNCMWLNYRTISGNIAIASQSGTFAGHPFMMLKERGIGLSYSLSVGNEANIDLVDCLEFFATDPHTDVICLYIEEIKRGREFFKLAKEITRKKPIIAMYVGGSESGAKAVASHTGSMAGNDNVFNGMFAQVGIIRVYHVDEMIDTASLFSRAMKYQMFPKGKRLAIVTNSGGPGATLADRASRMNISLPDFSPELSRKIAELLPSVAKPGNPLDYTFTVNPSVFFNTVPKLLAKSGEFDAIIAYGAYGPAFVHVESDFGKNILASPQNQVILTQFREMVEASIEAARRLLKKYKIPIIYINMLGDEDSVFPYLNKNGFPCYRMPQQAIIALNHLFEYAQFHNHSTSEKRFEIM